MPTPEEDRKIKTIASGVAALCDEVYPDVSAGLVGNALQLAMSWMAAKHIKAYRPELTDVEISAHAERIYNETCSLVATSLLRLGAPVESRIYGPTTRRN